MKSLAEAIKSRKEEQAYTAKWQARTIAAAKAHHIDKLAEALVAIDPAVDVWVGTYSVNVTVPVKSMAHILDVLEYAEKITGFDFSSSNDNSYSGQRVFSDPQQNWFNLVAQIPVDNPDGDATCIRVPDKTVVEERVTYKLVCL